MHRPNYLKITANGTTAAYPLDRYVNGYALAMTYSSSSMSMTYTIQQSFLSPYEDESGNPYSSSYKVSGQWINMNDSAFVAQTAATASNFAFPPRAIRAIVTNVSGGGSATFSIIPMGMDAN